MRARLLTILLTMLLALPVTAVLPPVQASNQLEEQPAPTLAAKNKNTKGKPKFKTVTRTVRQSVTQTFANPALIDVSNSDAGLVKANPYPAVINVAGLLNGVVLDVDVVLNGFTWNSPSVPDDADILLAASQMPGANAIVLSDVGGADGVTNLILTLDDEAAAALPDSSTPFVGGTFRPTNIASGDVDTFPAPAPLPSGNVALNVFDGGNPNGTWQLFVVDEVGSSDPGSITSGWSLTITALADVQVQEQVKVKKKNKKKGKGRR